MRKLTIILLLALLSVACHEDAHVQSVLDAADREIFQSPDSAVIMLDSLDVSGASEAQRARHALLLTKARVKAHIIVTDTTLINSAVKYYSGCGDSLEVQSLYYHGLTLSNIKKYSEGLITLMEASDCAEALNDNFYYAMSCREQANIYSRLYEFEQAANFSRLAIVAFNNCNKPLHAIAEQLELAQALVYSDHIKDAYDLIMKLDKDSLIHSDPLLQQSFYYKATNICYNHNDLNNAEKYFDKIVYDRYKSQSLLLSQMSLVYLFNGNIDKAWLLYESAKKTSVSHNDTLAFKNSLVELYADRGDYEKAYRLQSQTHQSLNKETNKLIAHPYTALVNKYYKSESDFKSKLLDEAYLRIIAWVSVSVALLLMVILLIIFYRRRIVRKESEKDILLGAVSRLESQVSMLLSKQDAVKSEKSFSMAFINTICEARNAMLSRDDGLQRFGKNISDIIFELTSNKNLSTMETLINATNDNLMERFMAQVPDVSERERKIAIFIFLGFSNTSIAAIMQYKSTVNVRQVRHKLKNKILANPTADSVLFLSYIAAGRTPGSE